MTSDETETQMNSGNVDLTDKEFQQDLTMDTDRHTCFDATW